MDKSVVDQKASEIRRLLETWIGEIGLLKPGEQLVFTLEVRQYEKVVRVARATTFEDMPFHQFFTRKRMEAAGLSTSLNFARITGAWSRQRLDEKFPSVGALAKAGKAEFRRQTYRIGDGGGLGDKARELVDQVLTHFGIEFME